MQGKVDKQRNKTTSGGMNQSTQGRKTNMRRKQ